MHCPSVATGDLPKENFLEVFLRVSNPSRSLNKYEEISVQYPVSSSKYNALYPRLYRFAWTSQFI